MKAYLVELGVLVEKNFDNGNYSVLPNYRYLFYEEDQYYREDFSDAISDAKEYVLHGVDNAYAVIVETPFEKGYSQEELDLLQIDGAWTTDKVVYSIAKINGEFKENFVEVTAHHLFIGNNRHEDFTVCIYAKDEQEAIEIAEEYRIDSGFEGEFVVCNIQDWQGSHIDCDYIITK